MNGTLSRLIYRLAQIAPRIEILIILAWIVFFPFKDSPLYFLIFALLIGLLSLRNIVFLKNLSLSPFSYSLLCFNLLLILSVFFAQSTLKAIYPAADVFLISFFFLLTFHDKTSVTDFLQLTTHIISLVSFVAIINYIFTISEHKNIFFASPIHQGIASGMAVLVLLYSLLNKNNPWKFRDLLERENLPIFGLLILNTGGVYASQSKAAFIGIVLFSLILLISKTKKRYRTKKNSEPETSTPFVYNNIHPTKKPNFIITGTGGLAFAIIIVVVLTFIIPNPIKTMFTFSLKKDPYSTNRINIWKMSWEVFEDQPLTGVGLDNFKIVARKYNFKLENGPANYFKLPARTHNDYLKLVSETGILGLIFLLFFSFFLLRRIFRGSLFDPAKITILYLLFQAFLFNLLFQTFFFFIMIFLLKNLFEEDDGMVHRSFTLNLKSYFIFILLVVFAGGYLLPFFSQRLVKKAETSTDVIKSFNLLQTAGYLNPLDQDVYYLKALALQAYFKKTLNLDAFYSAKKNAQTAQKLNPYFIDAYLLESDLHAYLLEKNYGYDGLESEIIAPLLAAEKIAPLNPFLKMRQAEIYLKFNHMERARLAADAALQLEPDYVSALYFMHRYFDYIPEEGAFQMHIQKLIEEKKPFISPGTYLEKLSKVPGPVAQSS